MNFRQDYSYYQPYFFYFYQNPVMVQPFVNHSSLVAKTENQSINVQPTNQKSCFPERNLSKNLLKKTNSQEDSKPIKSSSKNRVKKNKFKKDSIDQETEKQQKEGRNTGSNILRTFSKNLTSGRMNSVIETLIDKFQLDVNQIEFLKWVEEIGITHRNYVKVPSVGKKMKQSCDKSRLLILLLSYQMETGRLHILTSTKIKKQNKRLTLSRLRTLVQEILAQIKKVSNENSPEV